MTRTELNAINRRADEVGAAVRYVFRPTERRVFGRRLELVQAVVMSQVDSNALAREHKARRKAHKRAETIR